MEQSAVEFPGNCRIHIALAVTNLEHSKIFYETLFGVSPSKVRPDYVKFEPQDPSVNLTLNEVKKVRIDEESPAHFGVQVKSSQSVQSAIERLSDAGLAIEEEENTTCCYAVQDKVWATDPDGNRWEVFVVLEADANQYKNDDSPCCASDSGRNDNTSCC